MHKHTPLLSFLAILCATCATRPDPAPTADPSPAAKPDATQPAPAPPRPRAPAQPVQWIWASPNASASEVVALQRTFDVPRPIARATLRGSADNRVRLFLNGELVTEHDEWRTGIEAEVGPYLRLGSNSLVLCAQNEGGPAAAWAELEVEDPSGRRVRVVSDGSWSAVRVDADVGFTSWEPHDFDEARSGPAHSFGPLGIAPWLDVQGFPPIAAPEVEEEPDEPPLAASALELLRGFEAELVYVVPKRAQGSWVTLCEDPQGRLYTSDQHGRLYRIVIPSGDSRAEPIVELVDIEIGSAHGLCWAFDSLYVVVSERDPGRVCGLYRVRDTNADDELDQTVLVREFDGNGEHGPHAVVLGPDGALWIMGGNHTALPEPIDSYRRPKTWGEDELLPTIPDPNGHAVGITAPGGWVVRTDEHGEKWELWTAGFRNAYDMAFDERGELFTFDSDMEWDVGAPWYRPTRILHCVSGAEFGWRTGSGNWPTDWPDTWPSTCDVGRGSPTGTIFGTGAKFPEKYRRALYACDWALGRIYAVHMTPRGASWSGEAEVFARGEPFPVTDAIVAQDGAMYIVTGGRGTQSGLYRITSKGPPDGSRAPAPQLSAEQEERRALEKLHVPRERTSDELALIAHGLASPDPFLGGAARVALEHTPQDQWGSVGSTCATPLPAARFIMASILAGSADPQITDATLEGLLLGAPVEVARIDVLRLVQLALLRVDVPLDARERLRMLLRWDDAAGDARIERELARMLAWFEQPGIVEKLLQRIDASTTQEDAIHYAYCLRTVETGWTPELRARFLDFLDGRARTFRGGESLEKFVGVIRREFVEAIPAEERDALGIRLEPARSTATKSSAVPAAAPAFVHRWTRAELDQLLHEWPAGRDAAAGRAAYDKATCATCHRTGDGGGATGPDLTGVSSRFGRADLLESMLEPSRTISDQYRDTELRTTEGDLYVGRIEAERNGLIVLRRTPGDERVEIDAASVEMRRPYPLSRMPSGLLDVLSEDEVLDLFAYLRATR